MRATAVSARQSPTMAAASSAITSTIVGSRVSRTAFRQVLPRESNRNSPKATRKLTASIASEMPKTP